MVSVSHSVSQVGINGQLITIEIDSSSGLPGIMIVGLPDKSVEEARERIRSAIKNSGYKLPPKRLTVNLLPADIPKRGSCFDLPIALGILSASGQLSHLPSRSLFLGELSLNGDIKPAGNGLVAAEIANSDGFDSLFLPHRVVDQANLLGGPTIYSVATLKQVVEHLAGISNLKPYQGTRRSVAPQAFYLDMKDIFGQEAAKRALTIAAAGGHNILLSGPPGSGKTMLAQASQSILPPLNQAEQVELTRIYGMSSVQADGLVESRPFRSPHHSASTVAMIGGGNPIHPGEISLAHHGILFLDEVAEFPRQVMEVLRQPLEDGCVSVARSSGRYRLPAKFMLIAAHNPCPCGYAGDPDHPCSCSLAQISRYQRKLSGPLLDRIDLHIELRRPNQAALLKRQVGASSAQLAEGVQRARAIQNSRFGCATRLNAHLTNQELKSYCALSPSTEALLASAMQQLALSARAYHRVLKVARTIADLEDSQHITSTQVTEALQYRERSNVN